MSTAEILIALERSAERYARSDRIEQAIAFEHAAVNAWRFAANGQLRSEMERDELTRSKLIPVWWLLTPM